MENILFLEREGVVRETILKGMLDRQLPVVAFQRSEDLLNSGENLKAKWCILDMDVPDHNPYYIAGRVRRKHPDAILLFWGTMPPSKTVLLELGILGTGYIKKTLDLDEFMPKLLHYLNDDHKRLWQTSEAAFNFGNSRLSVGDQQLSTPVDNYHLTLKETALLEMLLLHKNDVLPREKSLGLIWGRLDYYTARSMDVCVSKLKRKLSGDSAISIVNLRSIGHKLLISGN
ncbi:winged helix-turn-helix domain-containing protein [Pedobacter sp. BMA]|uniref:winged helix-turn-helix domain-containing protein n=1 Tax=Pedobacter sp. BMA TaxID=1663685 RepID=UPI0006493BE2|nr:winged helix-turn-helix domain-containing protein [Pedobacter sp. BMA]KLT67444.1 hypothetical protein AB669_01750 [Pedobacter sp. BMA]